MDRIQCDLTHPVDAPSRLAGRRHAIGALGAVGMALVAGLGLHTPVQAKKKRRSKTRPVSTPGSQGPQGPAGAPGAPGATGAAGPDWVPVYKQGPASAGLAASAGAAVDSIVSCGTGKVLSCGYNLGATTEQMVNVIVKATGPDGGLATCQALIRRTADVAANMAGATIIASAICKP
jgi:hypothetical protein